MSGLENQERQLGNITQGRLADVALEPLLEQVGVLRKRLLASDPLISLEEGTVLSNLLQVLSLLSQVFPEVRNAVVKRLGEQVQASLLLVGLTESLRGLTELNSRALATKSTDPSEALPS